MQIKICSKCKIEKSIIAFYKNKKCKDGFQSQCKDCQLKCTYNWRANNPMNIKDWKIKYNQTIQGKAQKRVAKHKRRSLTNNANGSHTVKQLLELFDNQNGKCIYCKCRLHKAERNSFHVDHIVPLSKNGTNDISNIQLLCPNCNISKGAKNPEDFAQQFGMLI